MTRMARIGTCRNAPSARSLLVCPAMRRCVLPLRLSVQHLAVKARLELVMPGAAKGCFANAGPGIQQPTHVHSIAAAGKVPNRKEWNVRAELDSSTPITMSSLGLGDLSGSTESRRQYTGTIPLWHPHGPSQYSLFRFMGPGGSGNVGRSWFRCAGAGSGGIDRSGRCEAASRRR